MSVPIIANTQETIGAILHTKPGMKHWLRSTLLTIALTLASPLSGFSATSDILSVKDYGAVGNGTTDDAPAIQTAITQATTLKKSLFFPGGTYLINSTLNIGSLKIYGEGPRVEGGGNRSLLKAGTLGMTMVTCGSNASIESFGIQGNNTANIGIKITGSRATLKNIENFRCRKTCFLLAAAKNATLINCYATYCVTAFTLANGAQNNAFYTCTANNMSDYYNEAAMGVPYSDTVLIYFVIDTTDPDYGSTVTSGGNARNRWFGGIYERCPLALLWENLSQYSGTEGGMNRFSATEFSCSQIIDTQNSISPGTIIMDSCSCGFKDQSTAFGLGTAGFLKFEGEPYFSGGNNLQNRGITQKSNYPSLFVIDSDTFFTPTAYGAGSITLDSTNKEVTINGGDSSVGATFTAIARGNVANNATQIRVGEPFGFTAQLTFTITSITGTKPVLARMSLSASPWRRTVASCTAPGTYSIPVRIGDDPSDTMSVMFSANGNTSCTVKGVSLKAYGLPE